MRMKSELLNIKLSESMSLMRIIDKKNQDSFKYMEGKRLLSFSILELLKYVEFK